MITAASISARAAYAAALADVLPVDAHTTTLAPSSAAFEIAIVIPRSLNDPVGFAPSTFNITRAPTASDRRGASTSGVLPSHKVTSGVFSVTGNRARYAAMIPFHRAMVTFRLRRRAAPIRFVRRHRAHVRREWSPSVRLRARGE